MDGSKVGSAVVLLCLVAWIGASVVTFADGLLLDADWQAAAVVSLVLFGVGLGVVAAAGQPWRRWQRTPYW